MNPYLKHIQDLLVLNNQPAGCDREALQEALTEADKQWGITDFKLERTEQVKKTITILLEETIEELEEKRKAVEAQNRELEIEAALERVRSRAMAMHKTDELLDAAALVYKELSALGLTSMAISYAFVDEEEKNGSYYTINLDGTIPPFAFVFPHTETEVMRSILSSWKRQEPFHVIELGEEDTLKHQTYIGEHILNLIARNKIDMPFSVESFLAASPKTAVIYTFNFTQGYLFIIGEERLTAMQEEMVLRFAKVFGLTYRRFLDLKQAEAQAREAKIEAALERVRAKVMVMNKSQDLDETSLVFGEQLRILGIDWQFSYFWLVDEENSENTFWITWPDYKTSLSIYTLAEAEEYFNECLVAWRAKIKVHDNYVPPEEVPGWLATFQRVTDDAGGRAKEVMVPATFAQGVYYYDAMMKYGSFGICISKPATEEEKNIQYRFAVEFERAYTRFLDLKKAEAQAREAKIEAALERVRAKAMAMHKSEDLNGAVAIVFEELEHLNFEMLRCGIGIIDKERRSANAWITSLAGQGTTVQVWGEESMDLHPLLQGVYDAWLRHEDFSYVLQGEDMQRYYQTSGMGSVRLPDSQLVLSADEVSQQYYHIATFEAGGLFAFRETAFPEEAKTVMKRFAHVFNLTYKRFLDLQKAEAQGQQIELEKKRLEKTLAHLQATQAQLIQSEKMASLGEITAGIAHEIQNPLNFINNFSEVSNELLEEMKHELAAGHGQEAVTIADDLRQNLEKIVHHGQRADAIVKSMLQHSRAPSGEKQSTDINALADEYLRLSYHGFRAKDRSFNAILETHFDPGIGEANIVPQDIGRVLLNLFNNAFYSVSQKKKHFGAGYEPMVCVYTKRVDHKVEIAVKDNGVGIAQSALDKIYQPFFTTKPAGEGTGLGLSLSYEIIKAQGGEIKVETREGEGAEFVFQLPVQ